MAVSCFALNNNLNVSVSISESVAIDTRAKILRFVWILPLTHLFTFNFSSHKIPSVFVQIARCCVVVGHVCSRIKCTHNCVQSTQWKWKQNAQIAARQATGQNEANEKKNQYQNVFIILKTNNDRQSPFECCVSHAFAYTANTTLIYFYDTLTTVASPSRSFTFQFKSLIRLNRVELNSLIYVHTSHWNMKSAISIIDYDYLRWLFDGQRHVHIVQDCDSFSRNHLLSMHLSSSPGNHSLSFSLTSVCVHACIYLSSIVADRFFSWHHTSADSIKNPYST